MIRKATLHDVEFIEDTYNEHFEHELAYGAYTVFQKGVYPTRNDAEQAIGAGTLYVYETAETIAGSIVIDNIQPPKYAEIVWARDLPSDEVTVIHLLMVRPSMAGKGIASSLVQYAVELAKSNSCKAIRLDTGSQNIPAVSLYQKFGFQIAAVSSMKVGNTIEHGGHLFLEKVL